MELSILLCKIKGNLKLIFKQVTIKSTCCIHILTGIELALT